MKLPVSIALLLTLLSGCFPLPLRVTDRSVAEGILVCRDLQTPVANADVELADFTTGRSNTVKTASDGSFYIEIPGIRRTIVWYPLGPVDYREEKRFSLTASTASSRVKQWVAIRKSPFNENRIQFGTVALPDCAQRGP